MSADRIATVTPLPSRETPTPETAPQVPAVRRPQLPAVAAKVAEIVTPPDVWSDDRPALKKLWLYTRYGQWTRVDGVVRFLGAAYTTVMLLPTTVLYILAWIFERPSRFLLAAIVVALTKLAF